MAAPKVFVRSAYNYDPDNASSESGLACRDPSLAQQHQADEADINTIVRNFGITGQVPIIQRPPALTEFAEVVDYHTAQNMIRRAQESFMELPADLRSKFDNDPGAFVQFVDDPKNADALVELGIRVKPQEPVKAAVAAEAAAAPAK